LPNALAIGIDYKLFWHLNPTKLKPFREAYKIQTRLHREELEALAYGIGVYTARAVALIGGKSKFPDKPLGFFGTEELKNEGQQGFTDAEKFNMWAMQYGKSHNELTKSGWDN